MPNTFFMRRLLLCAALSCQAAGYLGAQMPPQPRIFQLSGMVVSQANSQPVPYATIRIGMNTKRETSTNLEGFYSIPVYETDTLYFIHIGYRRSKLVMREYLANYKGDKSQYVYVVNYLREDSTVFPTTNIFPYDTPEELKTAFLNYATTVTLAEKAARENLDPEVLHAIMQSLAVDKDERVMVARQLYYNAFDNRYLLPGVGLNPLAIARLLQYVAQKAEKRKNKDLNYWE